MRLPQCVLLALAVSCSVPAQTYTISTYAGSGLPVNIPGASAILRDVSAVAVDGAGNVFFSTGSVVLRLDAITGILSLVAGNGTQGFSGDNGPATSAQLWGPRSVTVDSAGNLYIADNYRIRKVSGGVITTVAGNGTFGFSGDNGPAPRKLFRTDVWGLEGQRGPSTQIDAGEIGEDAVAQQFEISTWKNSMTGETQ